MSQYSSRIHIYVLSPDIWRKFEDEDDAGFDLSELADHSRCSFVLDEWFAVEDELTDIVKALAKTLGKDGIIIADTRDFNVDPYDFCVYYLGADVHTEEFSIFRGKSKCGMFLETRIEDIDGWLSYGGFRVTQEEKEVLSRLGILVVGTHFAPISTKLILPDLVYLRETSFDKRPEIIEKTVIGEEVYFVLAKNSYDPMRLEVKSELGSLGYLPSDVGDQLAPILVNRLLKYTATVEELVPASQRNKHAKSSFVGLRIKAEMSEQAVPEKKSVPKLPDRENRLANEKNCTEEERKLKEEEARKAEEERKRKAEEARKAEEERKRKAEEARKAEEERKRKAEEARKAEEERKRKAEEASKAEEERKRKAEEARKAEEERKRKEEEARKAEEERKRKEEEARKAEEERKRKEEARQKAEAEVKAKREEELRKYKEAHKKWESECADITAKRSAFVDAKIAEEKATIVDAATKKRDDAIAKATVVLNEQKDRKALAESTLATLGVFRFGEKKAQRSIIEEAEKLLAEAQASISAAESSYQMDISEADKKSESNRAEFQITAEKDFPLPKEPKNPFLAV